MCTTVDDVIHGKLALGPQKITTSFVMPLLGPQKITTSFVMPGSMKHQAILATEFYSETPGDTFYEIFCVESFRVWQLLYHNHHYNYYIILFDFHCKRNN